MKLNRILWVIVILLLLPKVFDFCHEIYNITLKNITVSLSGNEKKLFRLPVKAIRKEWPNGECRQYGMTCREDPLSSGTVLYYPREEEVCIVFQKMHLIFVFVHHFIITDEGKKRELVETLKTIKPWRVRGLKVRKNPYALEFDENGELKTPEPEKTEPDANSKGE